MTFEQFLQTNTINFLIIISILVFISKKINLAGIIEKLADDVRLSVEKSAENAKSALGEYKSIKKSVKDTPKLQEEIMSSARDNAQNIKEKIEQKTIDSCNEIKANLEKIHKSQNEKYKNITIKEIYLASINLAQEEVIKQLDNDTHKSLIDSSINELEKLEGGLS